MLQPPTFFRVAGPLAAMLLLLVAARPQEPSRITSLQNVVAQAEILRAAHHPDQAAALLNTVLAAHPDNVEALTALARVRLDEVNTTDAQQLLRRALELSPNSPSANDLAGEILLGQHRYPEAMDRFETVLAVNLRDPDARQGELAAATQLALESRRAGRGEAAFACLQHAREHLPDDPVLLLDLGIQAEQVHQLPIAQEALEAALKLRPNDAQTLYALSRVELDREHFRDSEQHMRAYLALYPDDATAHFGLGHLLQMQQHVDEAKVEFGRSIDLQPLQTESYYQLGQIALDAGQLQVAPALFQKALTRDPRHGGALTGLGILAYRRKDFPEARRLLLAAVANSPEYQPAHYYLGLTLARLGSTADSERELHTAMEMEHKQDPYASSASRQLQSAPK